MNGVCCYDRARLPVARFGNTVARETTQGDEGSYRQSADGLWVNPFKHDLPFVFFLLFISLSAKSPHQPMMLYHFIFSKTKGGNMSSHCSCVHLSFFSVLFKTFHFPCV